MTIVVKKSVEELTELSENWDSIGAGSRTPMDLFIWTLSAAETVSRNQAMNVFCVLSDAGPVAIAPMVKRRRFLSSFMSLGGLELGEPSDFLFKDRDALSRLALELASRKLPILLPRVAAGSTTIDAILSAYDRHRILVKRAKKRCPFIELGSNKRGLGDILSKSIQSDLRRANRRAEELGDVRFEMNVPASESEFLRLFEEAQRVEMAGWKGRSKTALTLDDERSGFYAAFGRRATEMGISRIAFLRIDGKAVAMQLAVQYDHRYWLLKIGYDEAFSRCSPGQLLLFRSLEHAHTSGLKALEFLGNDAPWTKRWTSHERPTICFAVYPVTANGLGAFAVDFVARVTRGLQARARKIAPRFVRLL